MEKYGILGKTMEPSSWDRNIYFHFIKRTFLCCNHLFFRWSSMCVLFSGDKNKIEAKAPTSNWPRSKIMGPMDTASRLIIGRYAIIIVIIMITITIMIFSLERLFLWWGKLVTRRPYPVILACLLLTAVASLGFLNFRSVGFYLLLLLLLLLLLPPRCNTQTVVVIVVVDFIVIPRSHCLMPHSVIEQKNWLILESFLYKGNCLQNMKGWGSPNSWKCRIEDHLHVSEPDSPSVVLGGISGIIIVRSFGEIIAVSVLGKGLRAFKHFLGVFWVILKLLFSSSLLCALLERALLSRWLEIWFMATENTCVSHTVWIHSAHSTVCLSVPQCASVYLSVPQCTSVCLSVPQCGTVWHSAVPQRGRKSQKLLL